MGRVREFVGCRAIECADYDGEGGNLYSMWLTDTEVIRCRDCKRFEKPIDNQLGICNRWYSDMIEPNGFCAWAERREA